MRLKICRPYFETSIFCPFRLITLAAGGTSFRKATRGFSGPREIANPISTAMIIGYSTSSATSSGERRRIWRSLTSSQRIRQCPRWWRNATKADSKSRSVAPTACSSSRGEPANSRSPSASTITCAALRSASCTLWVE